MKLLFVFGVLLVQISFGAVRHDNYQLWRISTTAEQKPEVDALVEKYNLDVWSTQYDHIDALIAPELSFVLHTRLRKIRTSYEIKIQNIQELIDNQEAMRNARSSVESSMRIDVEIYHTLEEIHAYMDELAADFAYITVETLGESIEGREIKILKISTQEGNENAFWIQCGIHAREWVSPATCIYGLDRLTNGYQIDDEVTAFMDAHDIYMVPVVNPDGYSFTWTDNRMWRKNRRVNNGSSCMGVDLNRNYDDGISFGGEGSSADPCGEMYHGGSGFSEPETAFLRDKSVLILETQKLHTYYDIHSYGQYWLMPYGRTESFPANYEDLNRAAEAAVEAIFDIERTVYTYGSFGTLLYIASGAAVDWAYSVGAEYAYTPELRDQGQFGFILPDDQIVSTATEFWAGLFAAFATR